jgi:molybdenum cofactor guanylyltransferase
MKVTAAILAGGGARRLGGVVKGLVEVGGRAMVAREVDVLARVADEVLLVAGDVAPYRAIANVRLVEDLQPGRGPLAGLSAAFAATAADALLVVGCDLPFLDERLLARVRDGAPDADAVVPRLGGRPQPLHARYLRTVAAAVDARLARSSLRLMDLLDDLRVDYVEEEELRAIDPTLRGLINVNTPEQLAAARRAP